MSGPSSERKPKVAILGIHLEANSFTVGVRQCIDNPIAVTVETSFQTQTHRLTQQTFDTDGRIHYFIIT